MNLSIILKINFIIILFSCILSCSSNRKTTKSTEKQNSSTPKSEVEIDVPSNSIPDDTIEEEAPQFIEEIIEEEEMPVFEDQSVEGEIQYVASDLRKEFPKKDHIRIAKQLGVDIEEIYYYHNLSIVNAIYVNTEEVLDEKALKEIQTKIYRVLWDYDTANICTFFKSKNKFYAILSSDRKFGEDIGMIVYDYATLKKDLTTRFNSIKNSEDYPLKDKEIYGLYFNTWMLSSYEKTDLNKPTMQLITKDDEKNFTQYLIYSDKVYTKKPVSLYLNSDGIFYKNAHNSTMKVTPYGDLLGHSNDISFKEKYSVLYFKVD